MKPNFALSLSFDGLRLMHRVAGGWNLVGQVALDDADLTGALARLRAAADQLEPGGVTTKLLIPNDQIKYIAIDSTRAEDDDVRAALDGATPYAVDQLTYDFVKGGGRTYVAAVAKETLDEAQQFATEHGFDPVSFAAVPEPFTFVGEAHFGAVGTHEVERDAEPVVVIGAADIDTPEPSAPDTADPAVPEDAPETVEDVVVEDMPEPAHPVETIVEDAPADAPAPEVETQEDDVPDIAAPDVADVPDETPEAPTEPDSTPDETAEPQAPMFASRLRADRNEGRPAAPVDAPKSSSKRAEPALRRDQPPTLAVPTDTGTPAAPTLSAKRESDAPVVAAPITTDVPDPEVAPPVTGEAQTAVSPDVAAATLSITPKVDDKPSDDTTEAPARSAAAVATGAVGAARGMFASRRMARADAKPQEPEKKDEKSRKTVFGARKQPKPKPVVGGKPRFLGLILTAILLLFLLAIAAFAALSEEGFARWFGMGGDDTQIAATDTTTDPDASEVAALPPTDVDEKAIAPDALAAPTDPSGGQVLTPEEAQRIYAATGVWQRAPRIPLTPRTTSIDDLALSVIARPVVRVPPSPLADASSVAGDSVIATPVNPPAPDATFDFGSDGLVVATPQGALTPDGILIIAGTPPLNPPTRPGTVAPEVTPQDQLASVVPDTATPLADAPEGVVIIAGAPSIRPPVRTGTAAPAVAPQAEALASGAAPLVAQEGLLVIAGTPPVLPPVRPGTVAPSETPVEPVIAAPAVDPQTPAIADPTVAPEDLPEGLNVIAGSPPILPPVRPGTVAPQTDASVDSLTADVTAALAIPSTAQTPQANTARPLVRPDSIIQAAAAVANAPVLGALTASEAASFRPRTRPAGLAPVEPDPEPIIEDPATQAEAPANPTLQIAPEIAAAVQAAAARPNPIVNPTAQAVPVSSRPDSRPRNMARIVERANEAEARAATQVAAVAPRVVAPTGPTSSAVAQNATLENAINLREVNLIGIYGGSNDRRALVRMGNGRYVRVTVGDRLDGGRVTAITAGALSYTKRGRSITLQVPG